MVSKGEINISTVTLCRRLYLPIKDKMNRQKKSKTKLYVGQRDGSEGKSSCHASGCPEFLPQNPWWKEGTLKSCPLTSTCES